MPNRQLITTSHQRSGPKRTRERIRLRYLATIGLILSSWLWAATASAQTDGQEFVSISHQFAIKLPAGYEYKPFVPIKIGDQSYSIEIYKWNTAAGLITVGCMNGNRDLEQPEQSKRFLGDFRKLVLSRITNTARVVDEGSASLDSHPGLQFVVENSGVITAFRIFIVRNRFYMLTLVTEPSQRDASPSGEEIVLSFRLVPRSEAVAARDRNLSSLSWSPLPSDPSSSRPRTDAEDANLKGRVRQVMIEHEYIYDRTLSDTRYSEEMKEYSEKGYLDREVRFSSESPISITTFGHANGTLTAKKVLIGQGGNGRTVGLSATAPREQQIVRENKFKYREDGRLGEITIFENGEMIQRSILSYSANKRETETWEYFRVLRARTESRSKLTEILDSNGNPLETTASKYQSAGDPMAPGGRYEQKVSEEKCEYTYEFDSHGNWIKRTKFLRTFAKVRGTTVYTETVKEPVPSLVTYRTITYYQ